MNNERIGLLKKYYNTDPSLFTDSKRAEAILKDIFPDDRRTANTLSSALKISVLKELQSNTSGLPIDVLIPKITNHLIEEYGTNKEDAVKAVSIWAMILRMTDEKQASEITQRFVGIGSKMEPTSELQSSVINSYDDTRECPFCAEIIKKKAILCRYCNSEVNNASLISKPCVEIERDISTKNEKSWYLNIKKNGKYTVSEHNPEDGDYNIEIRSIHENGFLLQCYSSGHINKVKVSSILSKKIGREYSNGLNPDDKIIHLEVIEEDKIIGIEFKLDGETYFKGHLTEKISSRDLLYLKGYKVMYNDFDNISYITFPMTMHDEIERLVFSSFGATGKKIKNRNYKKEWGKIGSYKNKRI